MYIYVVVVTAANARCDTRILYSMHYLYLNQQVLAGLKCYGKLHVSRHCHNLRFQKNSYLIVLVCSYIQDNTLQEFCSSHACMGTYIKMPILVGQLWGFFYSCTLPFQLLRGEVGFNLLKQTDQSIMLKIDTIKL